jgi:single stranded DNA-binding protein
MYIDSANAVHVVGNLAAEPRLSTTQNGAMNLRLRVVVKEQFTGRDGQTRDKDTYLNAVVWGKQCQALQAKLTLGSTVQLVGSLTSWKPQDSTDWKTEIKAQSVNVVGQDLQLRSAASAGAAGVVAAVSRKPSAPLPADDFSDDLPF